MVVRRKLAIRSDVLWTESAIGPQSLFDAPIGRSLREAARQHQLALTVQSVVDAVDEVGRAGWQAHQVSLVLLGNVLELVIHSRNVVNVGHLTVGAVSANQAGNGGEHARKLAVGLDVGVVDVNLVSATQVPYSPKKPQK